MNKVTGTGEIILDIIFSDGKPLSATPGGSVFNSMVSLARSGITAMFTGELSCDHAGRMMTGFMLENRMSTDYIRIYTDGSSPVSLAFLDCNGDAEYQFFREPPLERMPLIFPEIDEGDVVMMGSRFAVDPLLRNDISRLVSMSREHMATVYYDINFRKPHVSEVKSLMPGFIENFDSADIVRCSTEDLSLLFPSMTVNDVYSKYMNGKLFIVTDGGNSIYLRNSRIEKYYRVKQIVPVSTIGAGDNFNAGAVFRIIKDRITDFSNVPEPVCDAIVESGNRFAQEVCMSMENYISK
jgi:fructokinase